MKKMVSIILALMLLTSCSAKTNTEEAESEVAQLQSYTAEKLSGIANYKKESLAIPDEMIMVYTFMPYNDGSEYLLLGSGRHTPQFWKVNADFTDYQEIEYPEFDIGKCYDLDTANDGTIVVFVNHADYGDLEPIGLYEYPEDYDEELYDANAEYKFMIKTYKDGQLITSADVSGYDGVAEKMSNINGVYSDGKILIAKLSGAYEIFRIDGSYIGELVCDEDYDIQEIGHDRTGRLICAVSYKENDEKKLKICLIGEDGKLSDMNSTVYNFSESVQGIQQGNGDYDFFIWSRSTVFGVKSGSYDIVPLMNINVAGVTSDTLKGVIPQEDGNMALMSANYSNYKVDFKKYIPRTDEEMEGIKVLTYGICDFDGQSQNIQDMINEWNDEGHDFMLQLKLYVIKDNNDGTGLIVDGLAEDVTSGNLPDILEVGNGNNFFHTDLGEKGLLCDLYEFIDNDKDFSRDSFVPNVLECLETDNKLYSIPNQFFLYAGKVAKAKFIDDAENWNFDRYVDMIINPPIDEEIPYDSKRERFRRFNVANWIDKNTATCHLTDDSFIKALNWCNIPDTIEPEYPDWANMETSYEEDLANYIIHQRSYMDEKEIFSSQTWRDYSGYPRCTRGEFAGEPIVFVDTPIIEDLTKLAISANSENKELAWEYIKSQMTDEYYADINYACAFPITKTGLEASEKYERTHYNDYTKFDETKDDPYWADYHGLVYQLGFSICGDTAIQIGEITDEDVKAVNEMISRAKPMPRTLFYTQDYYSIIYEETNRFFNGECTAEQCAETLQSRLSIYLSENFG